MASSSGLNRVEAAKTDVAVVILHDPIVPPDPFAQ